MQVLFVSAEVYPLAKTGGLADVCAALPRALAESDIDIRILMPAYRQTLARAPSIRKVLSLGDPLGCGDTRLLETYIPNSGVPVWLVDCPALYDRDGGLYQDGNGRDWQDNWLRFALLNHVAAGIAGEAGGRWRPDIVHANDWHAGPLPALLARHGGPRTPIVFTVHNLAYQGRFGLDCFDRLDLPPASLSAFEFHGGLSFLKAGIALADAVTTVSPTYASETMTPDYGCGLDGLLRERAARVTGILNGADYDVWGPSADPHIVRNYSENTVALKAVNKRVLQSEMGLDIDAEKPLLAFASRLVDQKMPDLVLQALPALISEGMQFALVAEGEPHYHQRFRELAESHPGRVAVKIGYDEVQAHRLLAGADILLHPSRFEPCGLVPIYAMRYGTIPVVRCCGGMADSVMDASSSALHQGIATGFSFKTGDVTDLLEAVRRAHSLYRQPIAWHRLRRTAMQQDFSWNRSAQAYADLYHSLADVPLRASGTRQRSIPMKLLA